MVFISRSFCAFLDLKLSRALLRFLPAWVRLLHPLNMASFELPAGQAVISLPFSEHFIYVKHLCLINF